MSSLGFLGTERRRHLSQDADACYADFSHPVIGDDGGDDGDDDGDVDEGDDEGDDDGDDDDDDEKSGKRQ